MDISPHCRLHAKTPNFLKKKERRGKKLRGKVMGISMGKTWLAGQGVAGKDGSVQGRRGGGGGGHARITGKNDTYFRS